MLLRPVPLVPGQAVALIEAVEDPHQAVPEHLGHDGGRGDRPAPPISLRHTHLAVLYIFYREAVNQDDVGPFGKDVEGPDHGQAGGPMDVERVYLRGRGQADADRRGFTDEGGSELGPEVRGDALRVVDGGDPSRRPADEPFGGKDDGGGDEGTEQGAPADLVDPGDEPRSAPQELFLEPEGGHGPGESALVLFEAGRFAFEVAEIVELRPADVGPADDLDLLDHLGMEREDALDADSEGDLADGEGGLH